jgi:UDP-N-acetylmuramyl-tripeptide synthetase
VDLNTLIEGLAIEPPEAFTPERLAAVSVADVTEDSRAVTPGALFIARPGLVADGRCFVADAILAGAVAILTDRTAGRVDATETPVLRCADPARTGAMLAERLLGEPSTRLALLGVTGTNGKTTVADLVAQIINRSGRRCGLIGTVAVDEGDGPRPATMTTPAAVDLSRSIARMVDAGCHAAAMEVSSHALHQRRVDALRFRVGVFTNLSGDHLDYHGTMEAYAAAKARLFELLSPDALAIVNADDPAAPTMLRFCRARALACTSGTPVADEPARRLAADVARVEIRSRTLEGTRLRLEGPWGRIEARSPLLGRHNAMNVLQAVAGVHALGVDAAAIEAAIPLLTTPRGRLERVPSPNPDADAAPRVFIDYAHTDDALKAALEALRGVLPARARLTCVFGCGGDRDRTKRPRMGRVAATLADQLVITSDNPRSEPPASIIDEILVGVAEAGGATPFRTEPDRVAAIRIAIEDARPGDVVLIAGKGHETEQISVDDHGAITRRPFDDAAEARAALKRLAAPSRQEVTL